jgi:hypothetical protein
VYKASASALLELPAEAAEKSALQSAHFNWSLHM